MKKPLISFVVAYSKQTRAMGKNNDLIWHIPEDMRHFREKTLNHPMIMGRKTFDSIGRPLPQRENIVITQNKEWFHEGVTVFTSIEEALAYAKTKDSEEITIIGGAQIFSLSLPYVTHMYLTIIDDPQEGDVYFPEFTENDFVETARVDKEWNGIEYSIVTLDKK